MYGIFRSAANAGRSTVSAGANAATSGVRNAQASRSLGRITGSQGGSGAGLPTPTPLDGGPMRGATSRLVAAFTNPGPSNGALIPRANHSAGQPGGRGHAGRSHTPGGPGEISRRVLAEGIGPSNGMFVPPKSQGAGHKSSGSRATAKGAGSGSRPSSPNSNSSRPGSPSSSSSRPGSPSRSSHAATQGGSSGNPVMPGPMGGRRLATGFSTPPNGLFVPPPPEQCHSNAATKSGGATGVTSLKGILKKPGGEQGHNLLRKPVTFYGKATVHPVGKEDRTPTPGESENLSPGKYARAMAEARRAQSAETKANTAANSGEANTKKGDRVRRRLERQAASAATPFKIPRPQVTTQSNGPFTIPRPKVTTTAPGPASGTTQSLAASGIGLPGSTGKQPPVAAPRVPKPSSPSAPPPVLARTIFYQRNADGSVTPPENNTDNSSSSSTTTAAMGAEAAGSPEESTQL